MSNQARPELEYKYVKYLWNDEEVGVLEGVDRLVYRSNKLGEDLSLTNTGGGNTSSKLREKDPLTGEDVWFRLVDYGEGSAAPADRKTFMGFENTPGIPTSEVYCQLQIWPADDARTWPVTEWNVQVK